MYEFSVVTIFPELFEPFICTSLLKKAREKSLITVSPIDLRAFTHDKHSVVDDAPYGGGSGMVMKPGPIMELLDAIGPHHRVLLTPQGAPFSQISAARLSKISPLLLFCGRYEGVDERARAQFDEEISIGDFVMFGGEVAAMAVIEAVARLLPGVLGNEYSTVEESFSDGFLEYPQYTRPEIIRNMRVPPVLISGNHNRVARWRRGQSLLRTRERRPDLFEKQDLSDFDAACLLEAETEKERNRKK